MAISDGSRGSLPIERWFDHVVRALTVAAIVWGFVTISDLRTEQAVMTTQLIGMNDRLSDLRAASLDRYTSGDARRDLSPLIDRLSDHEGRLRILERASPLPRTSE